MDETFLQPLATVFAATYAASRERAARPSEAITEAEKAVHAFVKLMNALNDEESK